MVYKEEVRNGLLFLCIYELLKIMLYYNSKIITSQRKEIIYMAWQDLRNLTEEEQRRKNKGHLVTEKQVENWERCRSKIKEYNESLTPEKAAERAANSAKSRKENQKRRQKFKEAVEQLLTEPALDKDGNEMDKSWAELITQRALQRATNYNECGNTAFMNLLAILEEAPTKNLGINIENLPEINLTGFDK